jgi:hypothetical protein
MVICGLVLGTGRQGVDVLLLRLFTVATGLLAGTVLGELKLGRTTMCPTALDCVQSVLVGALGAGLVGTVILGLVSIPVTVAWNRGPAVSDQRFAGRAREGMAVAAAVGGGRCNRLFLRSYPGCTVACIADRFWSPG